VTPRPEPLEPPPFGGVDLASAGRGPHLPRPERLDAPAESLRGVGRKLGLGLRALGLETLRDLLFDRPRRYEQPAPRTRIADLLAGQEATIACEVVGVRARTAGRRRLTIVEARVADETGPLTAIWFNQPWLVERLPTGARVVLRGAIERGGFVVRDHELAEDDGRMERPAPVYPGSEAIASRRVRELVTRVLPLVMEVPDPLPADMRAAHGLPLKRDALRLIHEPETLEQAEAGRRRLAFEELLVLQVGLARRRGGAAGAVAESLGEAGELLQRYRRALPFTLTPAQERVIADIDADLAGTTPMERLLQGDVGSGKTVVALYALLRAVERDRQGALMAPTETLAEQHFLTVDSLCTALGVRCLLLTGSVPAREQRAARQVLAGGEPAVVVGTHALIQQGVDLASLGVAVVDEQHRFGVEQRAALGDERTPHRLHMTATPIPRTLALTVYGDLAVSEIDGLPEGRKPVVTAWVTYERSGEAYTRLRRHLADGRQAYVVCPLVSPSAAIEARAVEGEAARLQSAELAAFRIGCLHGQLGTAERRSVMDAFSHGELDVLVATTVIEVGVDVPNATIMIVQEADRFGLAQLHQLRGRVGRGAEQSYCLLVSRPKEELTDAACERLQALVETTDGFELAEVDLDLRRAGQLLGTRQTGLSDLLFTRLRTDKSLLDRARRCARDLLEYDGPLVDDAERLFGRVGSDSLA
jgi:ATP-dependent DNA helicase RecG